MDKYQEAYSRLERALNEFNKRELSDTSYFAVYKRANMLDDYVSKYELKDFNDEEKEISPRRGDGISAKFNRVYFNSVCVAYYDENLKKTLIDLDFMNNPNTKEKHLMSLLIKINKYIGRKRFAEHQHELRLKADKKKELNRYKNNY
ncbi:MAG: hypothetical protein ACP5MT_02860 [Candidatus Acidifodinimicrobium sp.]